MDYSPVDSLCGLAKSEQSCETYLVSSATVLVAAVGHVESALPMPFSTALRASGDTSYDWSRQPYRDSFLTHTAQI